MYWLWRNESRQPPSVPLDLDLVVGHAVYLFASKTSRGPVCRVYLGEQMRARLRTAVSEQHSQVPSAAHLYVHLQMLTARPMPREKRLADFGWAVGAELACCL